MNTAKYPATGLSASTVTATYSTTFTKGFVKGSHMVQPDATFKKFGVGAVQQAVDGKIKVMVEYAK